MTIINQLDAISLVGNMEPFIIATTELISFKLKHNSNTIIDTTYTPNSVGQVTIDISNIVRNNLKYLIKADDFYEQTEIVKEFTAIINNQTISFTAIRSGVLNLSDTPANWLKQNFLTWQEQQKVVTYYSPEWLTYYGVQDSTVFLKAYFPGEVEQNVTLGSIPAGKAFSFNLQYAHVAGLFNNQYPTHYDVWVEDDSSNRLSYIQRYFYGEPLSELEQWFLFENSLGGLDTLRAYGDSDFDSQHEHMLSSIKDESVEYNTEITDRVYTKHTGFLNDYQRRWLLDLPPAHKKYVHHNGTILPIVFVESNFSYEQSDLPSAYSFKYKLSKNAAALNLQRNEEQIPPAITVPDVDSPGFFLPPRLAEFPRISLSEDTIIPAFGPHENKPTVTTVGQLIAVAVTEALSKIPGGDGSPGGGGQLVNIIKKDSISPGTDNDVFSSNRTRKEINDAIQALADSIDDYLSNLDEKYLSKINSDTAAAVIAFLQGLTTKELKSLVFAPGLLGEGFQIDEFGNATFDSITSRKHISAPEFRFNRTTVYTGIRWDTFGGGKIKNVVIDYDEEGNQLQSGIIELELEDGESGAVAVDDMAMGIFHNFGGMNDSTTEDQQNGNFRFKGFNTVYFRATEILESDNSRFRYALRSVSENWTQQHHPSQFMNFACYANPTDSDRQSSTYTTTNYTIRLKNMTTWEYGADNIYEISGKLDGFQIGNTILEGEGQAFGNAYIWGTLQQVYNNPVYMEIDNNGDGFLALGETMTITCRVMQGWTDITDTVETWRVERETGNQSEDTAWNIAHVNFDGVLDIIHTKEYSDLGNDLSTLFVFTAKAGENTASFHLRI